MRNLQLLVYSVCFLATSGAAQVTSQQDRNPPPETSIPVIRNDSRSEGPDRDADERQDPRIKKDRRTGQENDDRKDSRADTRRGSMRDRTEANEFQDAVEVSLGYQLPIYGGTLFQTAPSTFAPVEDVAVSDDFSIGPRDELIIRAWGQVDINYRAVVDRAGNIYLPKVGNIHVAGVRFGQVEGVIRREMERIFRNFELDVSMGRLRSIQVFIVGHARHPGTYTVSSLSSLVTALFAAGGPSTKGSLRSIELRRGGKAVSVFDLYDLLVKGDKSKDASLMNGDVIFIPPVGPLVALAGSVNAPAIYEIKPGATLSDVIEIAGGLTPTADGQKVTVERFFNRAVRTVEEFELTTEGLARPLRDGDLVEVRQLSARFENAVTLRGNVAKPGRYPWRENMRVKDLIPTRESLVTKEYWLRQSRMSLNAPARAKTEVEEREAKESDTGRKGVKPTKKTSKEEPDDELRNEIKRSGPEINWDYAVVQRLNRADLTTQLLPFNLANAIESPEKSDNLILQPGDVITIFSQLDVRPSQQKQSSFVRLEGELQNVGVFQTAPGETLRQLITRVGGLTPESYLFGAEFTRAATSKAQKEELDRLIDGMEVDFERTALNAEGLAPEQAASLKERADSHQRLIERLRELKPTGRIVLGLRPSDTGFQAVPDVVLEDGDRFFVPPRPATVEVLGEVYSPNSYLYKVDRAVGDYLRSAGGFRRSADKSHVYVVRADGSVVPRERGAGIFNSSFGGLRLMPGDTIVVPPQLDKGQFLKGLRDWSQVIAQFALGAASIRVISRP